MWSTKVIEQLGLTRDSIALGWSKWVGFAFAVIPALNALGADIEKFGIPKSWAPYIGLAALLITVSSAQHRTSKLPGKDDYLPVDPNTTAPPPGGATKILPLALLLCLLPSMAGAQVFTLPTQGERDAAALASWITYAVAEAVDAKASWDCGPGERVRCFEMQLVRASGTAVTVYVIKKILPRPRPCAPHDCGDDDPNSDWVSGHEANAFRTLPVWGRDCSTGPSFKVNFTLAMLTGGGRYASRRHTLTGIALGAGVGYAWDVATRCR